MSKRDFIYPSNSLKAYRTKFDMSHTVKGSFLHGKLIPFDVIEVLPGDTFKIDLASIIRMSTPIAPIMDNIHMFVSAWYVPNRLVYDNWEQLMGANKDGAWLTDQSTYVMPTITYTPSNAAVGCLGDYLGVQGLYSDPNYADLDINALPLRGYYLIWNENFRSEVVSAPIPIDHSDTDEVVVNGIASGPLGIDVGYYEHNPLPLGKFADYFTKALPQPIKHDPIPFIPSDLKVVGDNSAFNGSSFSYVYQGSSGGVAGYDNSYNASGLKADVDGTWNTIEALRVAFQVDKFYWKDGAYGTRYWEILQGHFGVTNAQGVLQLPQKLGEMRWRINVDQVLSTAGYAATSSTTVGAPGANSVTTNKGSLFTFSATEHGYIIIVGGTRHDHTYGQGIHKMWTRSDRLDFYDPVFANIGEQPIDTLEVYGDPAKAGTIFGYQEAWAEYRYLPDRVCGILNPDQSGALDFWTLADEFSAAPQLNETFIYENRNSIARALVTGNNGPDFIYDMYFKVTAVREMPLFSVPGLVDHH